MRAPPWPTLSPPAIVAESLLAVGQPIRTALRPGAAAPAAHVVRALAAGIALPGATDPAPEWLHPTQRRAYSRTLAALRRHRGALLAEPTGSGKTFIALAVAGRWQRGPIACIVPAGLAPQWRAAAHQVGLPLVVATHQQVSRGRLPVGTKGLVLVDESHHFRHPQILRYGHLADFLVGRPALLISATPIVNRVDDLAHQLRLVVRDDALALDGLASLTGSLASAPEALGALVILTDAARDRIPLRTVETTRTPIARTGRVLLAGIDKLGLSTDQGAARLIRGVLWRALASSPAALAAGLRRYQLLLAHAVDARAAGRNLSRQILRQWVGQAGDQLVLWELLPDLITASDLALEDDLRLTELIRGAETAASEGDPRLEQLAALLRDGKRTLVFTTARDTVAWLRRRLPDPVGWCTGEAAGLGPMRISRSALFTAFATEAGPRVLVASDVAAEGLDLQSAERVVHYDLPWTETRLRQREGRAARLGSRHAVVSVVRFEPPAELERRLRQSDAIARSARAAASAGIGVEDVWQWRDVLARRFAGSPSIEGVAAVCSRHSGALAGVTFEGDRGQTAIAPVLLWLDRDGGPRSDPGWLAARLDEAAHGRDRRWEQAELAGALDSLAAPVARRLRRAHQARWEASPGGATARIVVRRLTADARAAARDRNAARLRHLERALGIVCGGLTAGEARLLDRCVQASDDHLLATIAALVPRDPLPAAIPARLIGVVLFGPG